MSEKTDRRITRTKLLLRKALFELIEEKGIKRVTVKDLTEKANINRGTFYLHYRDPYDLIDQITEEMLEGLADIVRLLNPLELKEYAEKGEAYPISLRILEYMGEHADFFQYIFSPQGDLAFSIRIKDFIKQQFYKHVFVKFTHVKEPPVPYDYLFAYISSAHLGLLIHWFETGRQLSPYEMSRIITRIMYYGPLASFSEHLEQQK